MYFMFLYWVSFREIDFTQTSNNTTYLQFGTEKMISGVFRKATIRLFPIYLYKTY